MAVDEEVKVQYEKVAEGVIRVAEQTFDVYGILYKVKTPFEARVRGTHPTLSGYTAKYYKNGGRKPLVRAAAYDTEPKAVRGLLVQMALKSREDSVTRQLLEGIVVQKKK